MDERNFKEYDSYRNGSTRPPKSHGGMIAVLLIAVIFLGGIVSALSILNIQLTQNLAEDPDSPVIFHDADRKEQSDSAHTWPSLGISGEDVPEVYQRYYELPAGICIADVEEGSIAGAAGVTAGDILTGINGTEISGAQELDAALANCQPGQTVQLLLYRDKQQLTLSVTLPNS